MKINAVLTWLALAATWALLLVVYARSEITGRRLDAYLHHPSATISNDSLRNVTEDQHYGCTVAQQAPNGECK